MGTMEDWSRWRGRPVLRCRQVGGLRWHRLLRHLELQLLLGHWPESLQPTAPLVGPLSFPSTPEASDCPGGAPSHRGLGEDRWPQKEVVRDGDPGHLQPMNTSAASAPTPAWACFLLCLSRAGNSSH